MLDFFESIKEKVEENKQLTKGEIQFLVDVTEAYSGNSAYWPADVIDKYEAGEYN